MHIAHASQKITALYIAKLLKIKTIWHLSTLLSTIAHKYKAPLISRNILIVFWAQNDHNILVIIIFDLQKLTYSLHTDTYRSGASEVAEQQQQQQKEEKSSQVFTKEKSFGESSVSHQQQQEQKGTFPLHSLFHSFVLLFF